MKKPASTTNIELTSKDVEIEKLAEQPIVEVKIKFCTHVGWDGVLLLMFMLTLASSFVYVTYLYTNYFNNFQRKFAWLFMVMAASFFLLVIYYLMRWEKIVNSFMIKEGGETEKEEDTVMSFFQPLTTRYKSFQIFGKYYLWNLYAGEIAESIMQMVNMFTIYTCSLPVEITSIMCIALCIDCFHTVEFMVRQNSAKRRNRQIVIDTCLDFICTALPILLIWFGYQVYISAQDMVQIACFPAFMMLLKLDTVLEEIIRSRTAVAILKAQKRCAKSSFRRRESLFRNLTYYNIEDQQQAAVPYAIHIGAGLCKFLFGLAFLLIASVQLAIHNNLSCEPLLWKSCKIKTPFCGNLFQPTCNCAILNVQNHNWTSLPEDQIYEMNALKVMQINHGPLKKLPSRIDEVFKKLRILDLSNNKLMEVSDNLGNMKINRLLLANNKLKELPDSVWGNNNTYQFILDNNYISEISTSIQKAKLLSELLFSNNSVIEIPREVFKLKLVTLTADGNNIEKIPEEIGTLKSLMFLRFNNNNNIPQIPKTIDGLVNIREFDVRNNSIKFLPDEFKDLEKIEYAYFYGNPMCSNGWLEETSQEMREKIEIPGAGCSEQCSPYCQDAYFELKDCLRECNSVECQYQNGVCSD